MSRPSLLLALRPLRNQCEQAALRRCRPSYYNPLLLDRDVTCRTAPLSRRPFSTSPKCLITNAIKPHVKGKSQPSMALAMKRQREQMMRSGETPDDVGLQPNTFVMPHGANLPGLLTDTRTRLRMEWARLKIRSGEIVSMVFCKFYIKPHLKLRPWAIAPMAAEMHKKMYEQFASGDFLGRDPPMCEGLLASLRTRVGNRQVNTWLKWTLHKYLSKPRLVSYKVVVMPGEKGVSRREQSGLQQAVVRIHSLQSLQHMKRESVRGDDGKLVTRETPIEGAANMGGKDGKETVEYIVVQKWLRRGKHGPWMIWGTTGETTLRDLDKMNPKAVKSKR